MADFHFEVVVGHIAPNAIGHKQIFPSIIVYINEQRCPTPVGTVNSGQMRDFGVRAIAVVQL